MVRMTIEVPEGALASLHQDPQGFAREMRLAAPVKWFELRLVSQGQAAEIAGVSRGEFLDALRRFGVSPFQSSAEEIVAEAAGKAVSVRHHPAVEQLSGLVPSKVDAEGEYREHILEKHR